MDIDEKLINKMKKIVIDCGSILLNAEDDLEIRNKEGINNIVTKYDVLIQNILKKNLLELIPEASFIGEEDDYEDNNSDYTFIVDPIDGTTNFSRNLNLSAISVALLYKNEVIVGICYVPYVDELFEAVKGKGAFLNGKRIHVSNKKLKDGVVLCGFAPYYGELRDKTIDIQKKYISVASDYRRFGSAVIEICSIASGRAEMYFEIKLMPWDYAAASLILKEAGGKITTMDNKKIQFKESSSIIASNGVDNYLKYLK